MRRSPAWDVIWVGLAFRTGPAALAVDSIFPVYMFRAYSVVSADIRWPMWNGWRMAVGQQLLPVSAGILGLVGLVCGLRGLRREDTEAEQEGSWAAGGIFIPQLFYLISTFTYFRHVFHFQQFLWALVPAAAWQLQRLPIRFRTGFTLLWVPGALLVIRSAFLTTPWKLVEPLQFPSGGSIVVDAGIKAKLTLLSGMAAGGTALYAPVGSGWHFAYGAPIMSRHSWFFAPDAIRPYDQTEFVASLDGISAVVTCAMAVVICGRRTEVLRPAPFTTSS